ncbi:aminotransferase class III-fold pyridoxal phosphate-dependent enzyme [Planosporangium thailandense]|uniref:Aminotransferase class III-fold pyridoxal phosphate-dependent enzyme n=1 Tax=Planosporangium thailandense TaxID=765197 RepID=A0ABX0Y483_9ACTN|nr:aminotransferase class III-fold pyridoxal phosphate-dependent enzyme [Planosporangium thailandense]NJC72952.1 aminotransferase class III-fold pyridoxal phosphate-dependent enzyme [Planosporangium thailandense]
MALDLAGAESKRLRERALSVIPGAVNSNIRLSAPPVFFGRASGATLWDVDGRDYIDYVLGQGPHFLGHACERVNAAVAEACAQGMLFGASQALEVEAAELVLQALGWAERLRLGLTGTECVQAALRLSRAVTGRRKFVRFDGHYHGWLDNVLISPDERARQASDGQVGEYLNDSFILDWNDADALAELLREHGDSICAVIMEPVMVNTGGIEPRPGYLRRVRELCDQYGVVLIFDEVITGFRVARGGAVERYGVVPDLAIYGKAIGGGWPVAAVAGRADLMDEFGSGRVNHSGTFNGSVMAAAAVVATQRLLAENSPYDRVADYGNALMKGLAAVAADHGVALNVHGLPAAFHVSLGPQMPVPDLRTLNELDLAGYAALTDRFVAQGLWVMRRGIWFVSAAHGDAELDRTLDRFGAALGGASS